MSLPRKFSPQAKSALLLGSVAACAFVAGLLSSYEFGTASPGLRSPFVWAVLALCVGLGAIVGGLIAASIARRSAVSVSWTPAGERGEPSVEPNGASPSASGLEVALRTARETTAAVAERLSGPRIGRHSGAGARMPAARDPSGAAARRSDQTASPDVVWHQHRVTRERREALHGHRAAVLWFTGLPSSGKSTIANAIEETLHQLNCRSFVLDGDNVRHGLCGDLTFSEADREENIRRVAEVCRLFLDAGVIAIGAFVSPYRRDREGARALFRHDDFIEIYCRCPVEVCEGRDPKGLYRRARLGEVQKFTGVSAPYEEPESPEMVLDTSAQSIHACVEQVCELLRRRGILDERRTAHLTSQALAEPASS